MNVQDYAFVQRGFFFFAGEQYLNLVDQVFSTQLQDVIEQLT